MTCQDYVDVIESLNGADHCKNNEGELRRIIEFVACCREMGRVDLAKMLLTQIESKPLGKVPPISLLVKEQWSIIKSKRGPTADVLILGWNFTSAMIRWAGAGFKTRTKKEIKKRLAICRGCSEFENNACKKCGCFCNEKEQLLNKLALASEKCPLGKWE